MARPRSTAPAQMVYVESQGADEAELLLARLDRELANRQTLKKVIRYAARPMVKAGKKYVTKPGYPGDKTREQNLHDSIKTTFDENEPVVVGVIGPTAPHGWVVEHGHQIVQGGTIYHQKWARRGVRRNDWYAKVSAKTGRKGEGVVTGRTKPLHFMQKAILETQEELARRFDEKLAEEMQGIVRES